MIDAGQSAEIVAPIIYKRVSINIANNVYRCGQGCPDDGARDVAVSERLVDLACKD
jgi:hypothetical protein